MTAHGGSASAWAHALGAAALFAVDPLMNGVALRASPGPARDAWLAALRALLPAEMQMRRAPSQIGDDRWLGGVDIAASLRAGRPVAEQGLLAQCDGGVIVLSMAERLPTSAAAHFSRALDFGRIQAERDGMTLRHRARLGVIALDEGQGEDEAPPAALLDRLAFRIDLASIDHRAIAGPAELGAGDSGGASAFGRTSAPMLRRYAPLSSRPRNWAWPRCARLFSLCASLAPPAPCAGMCA